MATIAPFGYLVEIDSQLAQHVDSGLQPTPFGPPAVSLGTLHKGARGVVASVREDGAEVGDDLGSTVVMRLIEIGFVPGERFEIVAEARPGGDPIAVRVGGSCFALRRREADAVMVQLAAPSLSANGQP